VGVLFLGLYAHRSASHSNAGMAILFGSLLSIRPEELLWVGGLGFVTVCGLAVLFRPLLFSTVDPEAARARGVPVRLVSSAFLVLVALAAAGGAMAVGILLAASLLVAPAAAAVRLARRPGRALLLSVGLGIVTTWGGILISFLWPWRHLPVGFTVSALAAVVYFIAFAVRRNSYAGRGKTVIVGDNAETGQWISRRESPKRS
jgi:zinc/manganese transport system permease protein